jgi:hypothetical protein
MASSKHKTLLNLEEKLTWRTYLAYFIAGVFLTNGVPYFIQGISGQKFQSPFASPPGVGESSPLVNVLWGMTNFVIGFLLLFGVGTYKVGVNLPTIFVGIGSIITAIALSRHFSRVRVKTNS